MPVLPALTAVIGVGLQCTLQENYDMGHHYTCMEHVGLSASPIWDTVW